MTGFLFKRPLDPVIDVSDGWDCFEPLEGGVFFFSFHPVELF
jgi:hypothetical protein